MESINASLNRLFKTWKGRYSSKESFCKDGLINEQLYKTAAKKVLFIMKEPNDPNQESWDYRDWWNKEIYHGFSYRIAEWAFGILNDFPPYDKIWPENDHTRAHHALKCVAFMNLKKSGGKGQSEERQINEYIQRDKDLILNQIDIINPDIIITGLSWESSCELLFPNLDWKYSGYVIEITNYKGAKMVDFYHASSRNAPAASYSLLQNIIRSNAFKNL